MDGCEVIVAIDFGTSNIGFAFSFPPERNKIYLATDGPSFSQDEIQKSDATASSVIQEASVSLSSVHVTKLPQNRVPPVLLLNADGTINAFGKPAVDKYAQLVFTNRHQGYRYFENLKMELYKNDVLNRESEIQDNEGRKMKTLDLLSKVIRYIGKLALLSMRESITSDNKVNPDSVFWILTVPAIWSDSARLFMCEAAVEAGIPRERVRLVFEPEAAAIFLKNEVGKSGTMKFSVGNKYIVADLGAGIVDICIHEILPGGRLRELFKANGNNIGGNSVDDKFIILLIDIVTDTVWKTFFRHQYFDYVKLMRNFEEIKRKIDQDSKTIVIDLPPSLVKLAELNAKSDFNSIVKATRESEFITVKDKTKLLLQKEVFEGFFQPSLEEFINMVKNIFIECGDEEIKHLILAGGYAASPYVSGFIKREMTSTEVSLVPEPELAVLKGAVLIGFEPSDLIERRARYSYGFAIAQPFDEKDHPRNLKFYRDGKILCRDIFYKVIDKNQLLRVGDKFKVETRNNDRKFFKFKEREACAQFFRSTKDNPRFCTKDEGCTEVFTTKIEAPKRGWSERLCIDYVLVVGDTDFEVQAFDTFTGRKYATTVEFL